jgi:hypothetical protein
MSFNWSLPVSVSVTMSMSISWNFSVEIGNHGKITIEDENGHEYGSRRENRLGKGHRNGHISVSLFFFRFILMFVLIHAYFNGQLSPPSLKIVNGLLLTLTVAYFYLSAMFQLSVHSFFPIKSNITFFINGQHTVHIVRYQCGGGPIPAPLRSSGYISLHTNPFCKVH